jgi:S1-C subfamily serine protease
LEKGYVSRPFLGVFGLPLTAERTRILDLDAEIKHGLLIQEVFENSPAWEAGLRAGNEVTQFGGVRIRTGGDILLAIDGQAVKDAETVNKVLKSHVIGDTITLTVFRAGEEIELAVTLSQRPVPKS